MKAWTQENSKLKREKTWSLTVEGFVIVLIAQSIVDPVKRYKSKDAEMTGLLHYWCSLTTLIKYLILNVKWTFFFRKSCGQWTILFISTVIYGSDLDSWDQKLMIKLDMPKITCTNHVDKRGGGGFSDDHNT